jgi:Txe/YoeB family toxin of Txe-Axe toxin-antitoxin module
MKFKVERSFLKDFQRIKDNRIREKIQKVIENIAQADSLLQINNLEKISGTNDYYRIKFDYNYRIGIKADSEILELLRISSREGFYRLFP